MDMCSGVWHIDKQYRGRRICESTGENGLAEAERFELPTTWFVDSTVTITCCFYSAR